MTEPKTTEHEKTETTETERPVDPWAPVETTTRTETEKETTEEPAEDDKP